MSVKPAAVLRVGGHEVNITRPEKVLFREDGITKSNLIRYYQRISPWMLPYLEGRPLAMQRFPDGIDQPGFFQKAAAPYYPAWIKKATVPKAGGTVRHVICDDQATLVYLANQACITPHVWLSRIENRQYPDQMVFDLDPSREDIGAVIDAAEWLKRVLDDLQLPAFLKATGSRGLHVTVPLRPEQDFDSVRGFARTVAEIVVSHDPGRYTLEQSKNKRHGRVFIDVNRNDYAQTAGAVYAVRARNGAPVAVPLSWNELRKNHFRPDSVTLQTVFARLIRSETFGRVLGGAPSRWRKPGQPPTKAEIGTRLLRDRRSVSVRT
jgi:bifunctional non-homologous end joining protein LigD